MSYGLFDFSDGDVAWTISNDMAIDSQGNPMMRIGDSQAVDLNTGEIHFVYGWGQEGNTYSNDEDDDW